MERGPSSWGLSFASQIDFPPLWPGTSPPRRLPRLCSSGSGTSLIWILPTKEIAWVCIPSQCRLQAVAALPKCYSSLLLLTSSKQCSTGQQSVASHPTAARIPASPPLSRQSTICSVHPECTVTCPSPGALIHRLPY